MSEVEPAAGPAFPDEPCRVPPNESWSDLEKWVWQELCFGRVADINNKVGKIADPRKPEDWQDSRRRLAPSFLQDILVREPYRSELHRKGVRIRGAWFQSEMDLERAEVIRPLWLDRCRCEQPVVLTDLHTPHSVSLVGLACAADVRLSFARISGRVCLHNATVAGKLDMLSVEIGQSLFMLSDRSVAEHQAEFNDVALNGAKVGGHIALIGAKVTGRLDMDSVEIGQSLLLRSDRCVAQHQAQFKDIDLNGAKIDGQVSLIGAKVTGTLDMDSVSIGQLLMRSDRRVSEHRAEFNDIILRGAKVGAQVALIGAKVIGRLDMDSVEIGQNLLMRSDRRIAEHRAEFNDIILRGAKVGGQVSLIGARVAGWLNIGSAKIGESLFMHSSPGEAEELAEFDENVSLIFAEVGSNLDVRGAVLTSLDLTGASIRGELRLASSSWSPRWQGRGKLVLRNASADAIGDTDEKDVWPLHLDLDGFVYRRLGGLGAEAEAGVATRGSPWYIDWLANAEPYAPQPYEQCARVLREMGHPEMANDVLYQGRERERKEAWRTGNNPRGTGLTILKWFIGYGYGQRLLWRPLAWVAGLVLLGTVILNLAGLPTGLAGSQLAAAAYSFDMLLPIIELEKSHLDIVLVGWVKYYFYVQKMMGYVLASFLIAGLAGLTK